MLYKGEKTREISFPLGGIGTGCIGLAGDGRLIDWEIFNRPNKGSYNGFSHFAVKAEMDGKVIDARVMCGDFQPPYIGDLHYPNFQGFGFGVNRYSMAGLPHFKETEFNGEFPFAQINFIHERFPGSIKMTAFNPFIPLNDRDSSIPAAFFEIEITNVTQASVTYTIALSITNPLKEGINEYKKVDDINMVHLYTNLSDDDINYGELCIATDWQDISYQEYWYRGRWFDNLEKYWRDFTSPGRLTNRTYRKENDSYIQNSSTQDTCSLVAHIPIEPGDSKKVRFIITWHFPNCYNYWSDKTCEGDSCCKKPRTWKNYYSTIFNSAIESAVYSLKNWDRLYLQTLAFKEALFSSTLPPEVIDAVSANISILKTPTCLRLEDGSFYGFEGCHCDSGCCEGSCTHVWNYAYALPFLFPKLERSMRDLDFKYNQREDGGMAFRLLLPPGSGRWNFRPCVDGQMGNIIKVYRDWKISGNTQWLKQHWDAVKKALEFAWSDSNEDKWDIDRDGVIEGRQHHTLDMELFGPNSWLTGFYLAALKAAAEIAEYFGEKDKSKEYMALFSKGKEWVDNNLFNGEYYHQLVDLKDRSVLERFDKGSTLTGDSAIEAYWDEEAQEIKYQIGEGCGIDQVVAQWHANLCGLGEIFDREKTKKALASIYKYNFKKDGMRDFFNPCRVFCLNDERGVVICEWPSHRKRPAVPVTYAQETMNGFEYQVACHMIQEGMVKEGLEIVKAIRDRYDGYKRNPWNEIECGSNYARSMASFALLLAFSGFEYDMVNGMIGFSPILIDGIKHFKSFWSLEPAWGVFELHNGRAILKVCYGSLKLKVFRLSVLKNKSVISINGLRTDEYRQEGDKVIFENWISVDENNPMEVIF